MQSKNRTVLDLESKEEVIQYFMKPERYCNIQLPPYFDFSEILDFARKAIGKGEYQNISKEAKSQGPKIRERVNHILRVSKDGKNTYRDLQIANPFIYYDLVQTIANEWDTIKSRFRYFKNGRCIVSSIPPIPAEKNSTTAASVKSWYDNMEQKTIELSLEYKYVITTDIANCYPSMYTHTIAWALHGKDMAKKAKLRGGGNEPKTKDVAKKAKLVEGENEPKAKKLLGDRIDVLIEAMQNAQTNGIPQGSVLFDFIAEMVLGYADMLLYEKLGNGDKQDDQDKPKELGNMDNQDEQEKQKKREELGKQGEQEKQKKQEEQGKQREQGNRDKDYFILRYRDDYRIFANSLDRLQEISTQLQEVLNGLSLRINEGKTSQSSDIITAAIKPDKAYYLSHPFVFKKEKGLWTSHLQKWLLYILEFSRKWPNSGTLLKLLDQTLDNLEKRRESATKQKKDNKTKPSGSYHVLIAIIVDIALRNPKTYCQSISVLSELIELSQDEKDLKKIIDKLNKFSNISLLNIWLQRLAIPYGRGGEFGDAEVLCEFVKKKLAGEELTEGPWNMDWVRDNIRKKIPYDSIINMKKLESLSKTMERKEASIFHY